MRKKISSQCIPDGINGNLIDFEVAMALVSTDLQRKTMENFFLQNKQIRSCYFIVQSTYFEHCVRFLCHVNNLFAALPLEGRQ